MGVVSSGFDFRYERNAQPPGKQHWKRSLDMRDELRSDMRIGPGILMQAICRVGLQIELARSGTNKFTTVDSKRDRGCVLSDVASAVLFIRAEKPEARCASR